jgi:hypothetical protein
MFLKLVKLVMTTILDGGVKDSDVSDLSLDVKEKMGTYTIGIGSTIVLEPKKVLTPKEKRRKNLIIILLISLIFMIGLSTIGAWLPDAQASLGRTLILLSEIPAFAYSLVSTRFLMKKASRRKVTN